MKHRSFLSIFMTLILVGNMVVFAFTPQPTHAAIKSNVASFGGCYTGGVLSAYLSAKVKEGVEKLAKLTVEHIKNAAIGKLVSGFLGGLLRNNVPVSDRDAPTAINSMFTAQEQNRIIARCLAREIQNGMINNILQVARTGGRDGGATFIKNWANFQTGAQYRGENIFRAELSTAKLCDYLATDVKKSFGVDPNKKIQIPTSQNTRSDSLQPFSLSSKCTMPAGWTPEKYQQDFAGNGGWNAFARLLEPQNNITGLTALSLDEIQKQRALAVSADTNQAIANNGYLGRSGNGKADSCAVKGAAGQCLFYKDIKTTGTYISQSIGATIGAEFAWLTTAQGLNNIIANATEVMLNRLLDLGNPDEGQYRQANDGGPAVTDTSSGSPPDPNIPPDGSEPPLPEDGYTRHPDQKAVVAAAKADLVAQDVSLVGPCGSFAISREVAYRLRSEGAGVLKKPTGNQCRGYSTDFIMYPDGYSYDILGSAGDADFPEVEGANIPDWRFDGVIEDLSRYQPVTDPNSP